MTHRFPIKEIARQAGLGTATVDRVLNDRPHVSPQTRSRVRAALAELEAQEQQLSARGRRMFIDIVVEAPSRFSRQIANACTAILPEPGEAVFRPRFLFQETMSNDDMVALLRRIRRRGSQGVVLKARNVTPVCDAVGALDAAGIPVVTLVTDLPGSARCAYVGIDNMKAGRTAAYLVSQVLAAGDPVVVTSRSQLDFQGEADRYRSFRNELTSLRPNVRMLEASGGAGLATGTEQQLSASLHGVERVDAVYSMGGGNRAILDVLSANGLEPKHFIAHDMDRENGDLLRAGRIDFVLHHDLRSDLRTAFQAISARHGLSPALEGQLYSDVQIITPHNVPGGSER